MKLPPEDTQAEAPTRVDLGTLPTVKVDTHATLQQQVDALEAATLRGMATGEARAERLARGEHARGKVVGIVWGVVLGAAVLLAGAVTYVLVSRIIAP